MLAIQPATEAEVLGWIRHNPEVNLGVILGEPSGWLNVVDVDRPLTAPLHLPPTVQTITARGVHLYYRTDKPLRTRKCAWGEFRADGAYVAIPPSRHPSGADYTWADYCSPFDHPIAELPSDLLEAIEREQEELASHLGDKVRKTNICSYTPSPTPPSAAVDLVEWVSREDAAFALMRLCGMEVSRLGASFRCPLPGHQERRSSAALWRQEDGTIGFHDFHMKSGPAWYSLAEVFASYRAGRVMKLKSGERAAWLIRGLVEAGLIRAPRILAPKLPADAPPAVRTVYAGFQRLLECRAVYNAEQEGAPFAWAFASAWCGKGERHVGKAIQWLIRHGFLRVVQDGSVGTGKRSLTILALGAGNSKAGEKR